MAHSDVPHFQHGLFISWRHLGGVGKPGQDWGGCCRGVQGDQRDPGDQQETGAALTEREEQIIASLAELAGADTGAVGQ